jgi:hypothetical protein
MYRTARLIRSKSRHALGPFSMADHPVYPVRTAYTALAVCYGHREVFTTLQCALCPAEMARRKVLVVFAVRLWLRQPEH